MGVRKSMRWLLLLVRLPPGPSRHRVAIWRALHRIGALSLSQGTWAVPDVPVFAEGMAAVIELAARGGGEVLVLAATGHGEQDAARLEAGFTAARDEEWREFLAECEKFEAEIDKEIRTRKFTLAELEEEEESLERLRRWHRGLKARDVFGSPAVLSANEQLKHAAERLEQYTNQVFEALHQL